MIPMHIIMGREALTTAERVSISGREGERETTTTTTINTVTDTL